MINKVVRFIAFYGRRILFLLDFRRQRYDIIWFVVPFHYGKIRALRISYIVGLQTETFTTISAPMEKCIYGSEKMSSESPFFAQKQPQKAIFCLCMQTQRQWQGMREIYPNVVSFLYSPSVGECQRVVFNRLLPFPFPLDAFNVSAHVVGVEEISDKCKRMHEIFR